MFRKQLKFKNFPITFSFRTVGDSMAMSKFNPILAEKIALSCNILDMWGHGDFTVGHVSAREPEQTYLHMKGKGLGLEEVKSQNII